MAFLPGMEWKTKSLQKAGSSKVGVRVGGADRMIKGVHSYLEDSGPNG